MLSVITGRRAAWLAQLNLRLLSTLHGRCTFLSDQYYLTCDWVKQCVLMETEELDRGDARRPGGNVSEERYAEFWPVPIKVPMDNEDSEPWGNRLIPFSLENGRSNGVRVHT